MNGFLEQVESTRCRVFVMVKGTYLEENRGVAKDRESGRAKERDREERREREKERKTND